MTISPTQFGDEPLKMAVETVEYENAIVTFLDILGFREIVLSSSAQKTATILEAIEYFSKPSQDIQDNDYKPFVHIFSDSIIRIRPVEREANKKNPMGLLWHELLDIVHIQGELTPHDVIIRGSISYGEIVTSETRVFGPALVRAYELEKNCAIFPRVIVDPELLAEFERNRLLRSHNLFEDDFKYVYTLLQEDNDGFWFVDYLAAMASEIEDPEIYLGFLSDHKKLITSRAHLKLPKNTIQKIMWLARYQNRLIASFHDDKYEHHGAKKNDYLISKEDIQTLINSGMILKKDED